MVANVPTVTAVGAAQDTVAMPEQGWIGIRLDMDEVPAEPLHGTVRLVVADVYPNSPADLADIVPGDWFVSIDGNPLSTHETWLRFTSDLRPGQSVLLVVGRNGDRNEVTLVADPAPAFVPPNPLGGLEVTWARLDSILDAFPGYSPAAPPWPWHTLPGISIHGGFGADSATLTITVGPQTTTGSVVVRPREDGGEVFMRLRQTGIAGAETESSPPAGGGGTDLTMSLDRFAEEELSVLIPQLLDGPMVLVLGGVLVRDLTTELGRSFAVEQGVLVTEVLPMSPGLQAGFLPGDVIVSVDDKAFEGAKGLRGLLAELDTPIELAVVRRKKPLKIVYPRPRG